MEHINYREILESKRLEITERLNCQRTYLFNYLRCKGVFDQEDIELILSEKTNKSRAGKFVDELLRKGQDGYQHFIDVIQVENTSLYESVTGLTHTCKPSPLIEHVPNPELNSGVCQFGLGMLADHQQRLYIELQEIHRQYSATLSAKQDLESRLVKANKDLEFEKERRVEYEKTFTPNMEEDNESCKNNEVLIFHECDELQKGIADRDVYIIVLQMKLLAEKEESDNLRQKVAELQHKTENMDQELRRVSAIYNQERSQSLKLSECIRLQGEDIQKMDVLKKKLRESQFQNILMRDERDSAKEELAELTKWAEALKTRFDVVEKEKYDYLEKTEFVTNNCANLKESMRSLQRNLSLSQLEAEEFKKRNEILAKDSEIYKKQRDCALDARKEAILERDNAVSERDQLQQQHNNLQRKRDKMNEDRALLIQDYDRLENRYTAAVEDLGNLRQKLNEKELEAGDLMRQLQEVEEKYRRNSCLLNMNKSPCKPCETNDTSHEAPRSPKPTDDDDDDDEDKSQSNKSPWRDRKLKSLLSSMKLRISGARTLDDIAKDPVSPASENMTLRVLQCLLPNLSSRPYSSIQPNNQSGVKSLSHIIERKMAIRRQIEVDKSAETKAVTLPCYPKDISAFIQRNETPTATNLSTTSELSLSAPNLTSLYADELDGLSEMLTVPFRERSKPIVGKVRRSQSDIK